jgi:hippurate hydrolase
MGNSMKLKALADQATAMTAELKKLRRELHQIPEFGLNLPKTLAVIERELQGLGEISLDHEISCATLVIRGGRPGPTVLLRADMDALAVTEDTGLDFASTNGYMHACGHDLHMAMGVGAAKLLHENREQLAGDVIMFFQSGEEGHGGADLMIERRMHLASGSMPIAAYGIHVFSVSTSGLFSCKAGPLMASAGDVIVKFTGKAGHGSMPWTGKDPITPMVQAIAGIQPMVTKSFSAFDQVIVNVGWINAGDTHTTNVMPETASFGATIRTFSKSHFERVRREIKILMESVAVSYGVEVEVEFLPASRVLNNHKANVERVQAVIEEGFGEERYETMQHPITGGEDFATILDHIPGAFVFLGAADPAIPMDHWQSNHSNKARFNDDILPDGAAVLAALAFDALSV